jgi:regulator of nucleoside diphosphate kinase
MFRSTTTVTRPDRDRLLDLTGARATALGWALFADELRREIDRARVVDRTRVPHDVVTMHSTVRTRDLATGVVEVHTLFYPEEADLRSGKLSVLAPLGTALLGTRAGDVVRVATGDGVRALKVDAVLYQPEAAGPRGELLASGEEAARGTARG